MRIGVLVRILGRDLVVHVEQVAVAVAHRRLAQPLDGVGEIEVDGVAGPADAEPVVAHALGGAGRDVAGHEVAERGVDALEVVVAFRLRDVGRGALVALGLRHPHPPVVAQRLAHQRELGLRFARQRDARGMDLRVARVREERALLVAAPDGGRVAVHRVGGQEEHRRVAAGGHDHRVGRVGLHRAVDQVAADDAARAAVHEHQVQHLAAREQLHRPASTCRISAL
jgi:hypothetical protein